MWWKRRLVFGSGVVLGVGGWEPGSSSAVFSFHSMAASGNRPGNQDGAHAGSSFQGGGAVGNHVNGNFGAVSAPYNSASAQALKHNPRLAVEWTQQEQFILEEGLAKYASDSDIIRLVKISVQSRNKTVRDLALRCKLMPKKESGKRRKDDHSKKNSKKGVSDTSAKSSHLAAQPGVPPNQLPMLPSDNDDEISIKAIGGPTGDLLEQNAQYFKQISANLSSYQVPENINLFCQIRENIRVILNDMNATGVIMKQMPPLPVKVNQELADSILPALGTGASMPM